MARRNISLPDDLDQRARSAGLNVSAIAQRAVAAELERQERLEGLDAWLDELDTVFGAPSDQAMVAARDWLAPAERPRRDPATVHRAEQAAG